MKGGPVVIVVMGMSGSSKTTIASLLGARLQWEVADADAFHSEANLQKMRSGIALTDEDYWPWLQAIAARIDATRGGQACPRPRRASSADSLSAPCGAVECLR